MDDRDEIILSMRGFIGQQAAKWSGLADIDDLIQVGFLVVLENWQAYDPHKVKPLTYFGRIISTKIMEYASQKLIRVPLSTLKNVRHGKGKPGTRERVTMATGRYVSLSTDNVQI